MLGDFLARQGYAVTVISLHQGELLPCDLTGLDAVVSLGGPMNVYEEDRYPFLKEEDVFLKKVLAAELPFLGICLGSQLLAKAAGGSVVRSPVEEIGWSNIHLTKEGGVDPLFRDLPSVLEVYQWHGDMSIVPPGGSLLAFSDGCPVQAFRAGKNAYGLQFHAEITQRSIEDWSQAYAPKKPEQRKAMLAHYEKVEKDFIRHGEILCRNFFSLSEKRAREARTH